MSLPSDIVMKFKSMGKQESAKVLRSECSNPPKLHKDSQLSILLDSILVPSVSIEDLEAIDWCKWLMAGGLTPEEFGDAVRKYDTTTKCGLVWTPNFVAYRCRTCGISPCMSLCTDCFKKGNHDQHDFNMFLSQAGGACDCGDTSVMKESGFCDRHGPNVERQLVVEPYDLMFVSQTMMPKIFLRLVQHLRENWAKLKYFKEAIQQSDPYLNMLLEFNGMGALMRSVMTATLTDPKIYDELLKVSETGANESEYQVYCHTSHRHYKYAIKALPNPEPPDEYKDCASLQEHLEHTTLLEELMFWTVAYEFPQKLVCLLLNMLPDASYKEALTRAFVLHYSRISMILERSSDPETLSNRVVHVSVQLFSNQQLALRMVDELKLLHVMVISLKYMMSKILIQNTLHDQDKNFHYVVDCSHNIMKNHCYWPIVSDLNNVLSHQPVAERFMSDDSLVEMWFEFISTFQGMNVNQRELNQHVEVEPNTYYAAFSAELEASAYPMWALVSHLRGRSTAALSRRILHLCLSALQDWLDAVNYTELNVSDNLQVSFHLPLHRYFAVFMCQSIHHQGARLHELLPPVDVLHLLMMHPLRVQVAFYEILNGMWTRNGLQIKGQAMTYNQCNFCNSMVDADLYLLQICATKLPADIFLKTVIDKFHIKDSIRISICYTSIDSEHSTQMLESCLIYLAILINNRTNLGLTEFEMSRLEMVTLLCIGDKTHSQLLEFMPEHCGTAQNKEVEIVLAEVAQYRAPNLEASGNMQQGMYGPKPEIWEKLYDPLHVLLRTVRREDYQTSLNRYRDYVKKHCGSLQSDGAVWPPFRRPAPVMSEYEDPRIVLNSKIFHATIFIILYKVVNGQNISELTVQLAIYLLELAVMNARLHGQSNTSLCQYEVRDKARIVNDSDLDGWFETPNIAENLRTIISRVEPLASECEIQWDISEIEDTPMIGDGVTENSLEVVPHMALVPDNEEEIVDSDMNVAVVRALPSISAPPPRLAVMSGNEVDFENTTYPLFSPPIETSTEIVSSTSNSTRYISRRNLQTNPLQPNSKIVGESIISLLLKLHLQLSGNLDCFTENQTDDSSENLDCDSRIGDGPFFVRKLLKSIAKLDTACEKHIVNTRNRLLPKIQESEEELRKREERERQEKKKRVIERQKEILAKYKNKQQQFAEAMEAEVGADMERDSGQMEYHCVICKQKTPSTESKPMGLVVLIQATSIVGHEREQPDRLELPLSDEHSINSTNGDKRSDHFDNRINILNEHFNTSSVLLSVNVGWEGGVHVQTCGHHLHLHCLKSYLQTLSSLPNQQRPQNATGERTEYLCPICQQQANSILPLSPQLGECASSTISRHSSTEATLTEVNNCLKEIQRNPVPSNLAFAMNRAMEDMTSCAYFKDKDKFYQKSESSRHESLFLLVTSIARTNLEIELVQHGGSLFYVSSPPVPPATLKRDCLIALLHVLATHVRVLIKWPVHLMWQQLSGLQDPFAVPQENQNEKSDVPFLLRDPTALLIQFVLVLPMNINQYCFSMVVKVLYNLLYYQVLLQVSGEMHPAEREEFAKSCIHGDRLYPPTTDSLLNVVINYFRRTKIYVNDEESSSVAGERANMHKIEKKVQTLCLPYLRIASLLRYHLYGHPFPDRSFESEFEKLVEYLELVRPNWDCSNSAEAMNWQNRESSEAVPQFWCDQYVKFIKSSENNAVAARSLINQHISWKIPKLLRLPREYEKIFTYYHERQCQRGHSVPPESCICLLCGTIVCLKQICCKTSNICEAVQHSIDCGAGTAMFLDVKTTYVIVIRGKKACLWGSLHLDAFAEEDRDLKRGKPLYLSQERYQLLEHQWLAHKFDHTKKVWVWHKNAL